MAIMDTRRCIFCFNTLKNTDICFETVDDREELDCDQVKLDFLRRTDPDMDENDLEAMSRRIERYQEGTDTFELDSETGIPLAWNQEMDGGAYRLKSKKRVCAFCHMPLPSQFGKRPNIMIGFCGNTGSGKTVYLLSLIHDMQAKVRRLSVTPDPVFYSGQKTDYEGMYKAMYENPDRDYLLPEATQPTEVLSPLVLNCEYRNKSFMITFYDMAGEGMKSPTYLARQAQFLENAEGIIYLKDPDYFPGMPKAGDVLKEHSYLNDLFAMITDRGTNRPRAHVAITMTKIDKLLNAYAGNKEFESIIGNSFDEEQYSVHANGFDVSRAYTMSGRMYKLYEWSNTRDQKILNTYHDQQRASQERKERRGLFSRMFHRRKEQEEKQERWVMLFGASQLGRNVSLFTDDWSTRVHVTPAPNGLRNVDPVLWLLYCYDLFPAREGSDD